MIVVPIEDATRLVTIKEGDDVATVEGAIVRVIPARSMSPADRALLKKKIIDMGAAHVWFAPAAAAAAVVLERAKEHRGEGVRDAIYDMVDKARTADRPKLRAVVDDALTRAGA